RSGAGRRALQLMQSAFERLPSMQASGAAGAADLLAERLRLALLDHAGVATDYSLREDMLERVKAYIDAHLHDPQLTLDRIAAAMGCSKRYLHKLFSDEEETLASCIWRVWFARTHKELGDP